MPFGSLLPSSFAQAVFSFDVRAFLGIEPTLEILYAQVKEAVKKSRHDGRKLMFTGHSLGGGLAQQIGGAEAIDTVVFSPVGHLYSQGRSGLSGLKETPIESNVVSVMPFGDMTSLIDAQRSLEQYIQCTTFNPGACHSLTRTACELFRQCGDPRFRSIDEACTRDVGPNWDEMPWTGFAWTE